MKRMITTLAFTALFAMSCDSGKKDDASGPKGKAAAAEGKAAAAEGKGEPKTCGKGELVDGDECVVLITPEKIGAINEKLGKLDEIQQQLDKIENLAAVVGVMDSLRELDAWKTATKTSSKFEKIDEMVTHLRQGADEFKKFNMALKDTRAKLADLSVTLQGMYDGSEATKTVEDARKKVSADLRTAIEPLQNQVAAAMKALEPVLDELSKVKDITAGICAMGALYGGGEDFTKACDTGKDAFGKAVTFLEEHKDAPQVLLADVVGMLDEQLAGLVDEETKALLTKAQGAVDEAGLGKPKEE